MPAGWERLHADIIRHWLAGRGKEAGEALYRQLLAATAWAAEHPPARKTPPWLEVLAELSNEPEKLRLRIKELADILSLAPNYLTAAFKSACGVPPGSWLEHRRFDLAISLLAQRETPIGQIAQAAGFLSHAAFSRKMRGWCGMTPTQCRKVLHSPQPRIRFTRFGQTIQPNE